MVNKIETDPNDSGRDNGSTAGLTTISDGLVKPIEWTIEQLDLARLRARIVANIGSKLLLLRRPLCPHPLPHYHSLLPFPGQNLCASNPGGGWPIALHAAKAIVTMLKVVFTFRYVTPDTGDNGKSTNSEQSGTRPTLHPPTFLTTLFALEKGGLYKDVRPRLIVRIRIEISVNRLRSIFPPPPILF